MKEGRFEVIENRELTSNGSIRQLKLKADNMDFRPGQFVNIEVDGHFLRRPISISEYSDGIMSLVVQIVGEGTRKIANARAGDSLNLLAGLGNGFSFPEKPVNADTVLIGGGVGYAPLIAVMKELRQKGCENPVAVFGFNGKSDVPLIQLEELQKEGFKITVTTMEGDFGMKGNSVEVVKRMIENGEINPEYFYACGPMPMLRAIKEHLPIDGEVSLEARMGCGFGACMGCTIETTDGPRRICKEGPVFKINTILE